MSSDNNSSISSHQSQKSPDLQQKKKKKKTTTKNKNKIIINISDCQYPVVSKVSKDMGWKLQNNQEATDWDIFWTDNAVQPQVLLRMQPHQKINHFPGMFNLSRKNMMGRYLMKMRKKFPHNYTFFPLTWMLPVEYHQLKAYYDSKPKGKARTFIVKPEALSQGKGIFLTRKLQDIDQTAHCVVQRYMHKPFLIDGLKFDLRIYVLVAGVDPLKIFIFHQGLTRLATQKYEPPTRQNMEDVCMHLTNYAINKDNPKFIFNNSAKDMSKGHKRSLTWFFEYMDEQGFKSKDLKQKIQEMIVKTMISGLPPITAQYKSCQPENYAGNMCFQLLGFDIMLTEKCEPVLLQINHTPSFSTDTPLDKHIKFNFIKDSLALMNINEKTKNLIIKQRRQACQRRVITGKKVKFTAEEKQKFKKAAQEERKIYEQQNLGGFKKIFPPDDQQKMKQYDEYIEFSFENYMRSTGTKKAFQQKKGQKTQAAFGSCFVKKQKDKQKQKEKQKDKQKISINQKPRDSAPEASNLLKRKYESQTKKQEHPEMKIQKNIVHSENFIKPLNSSVRSQKQIEKSEGFFKKDFRIQEIENLRKIESELQLRQKSQQTDQDKYYRIFHPIRYDSKTKDRVIEKKNLKNIEIMFESGENEEIRKNAHNTLTVTKGKNESMDRSKGNKTPAQMDKKKTKWQSKFCTMRTSQKQKIPITLNTLLISGFESNTNQSGNNIKKYQIK